MTAVDPSRPTTSPRATRWIVAAVVAVVVLVTAPILVLPQLDADDYRYLDLVQQVRAGKVDLLQASIIENRWDHLWWIDSEQVVRFFRPTLILSYLADDLLHHASASGLLLSNGLLYLATCLLATLLFARLLQPLLRPTTATALASLLFAGCAAHAETIWYVAGRNETLAALGFLGALWFHTSTGRRRGLALPCYLFALASKELTLPLPLLALAYDRLVARADPTLLGCLRRGRALYAGYVALAVGYLVLRQVVLTRAGGSDLVFPYFVAPSRPDFAAHVWHQVRTYGENLFLAGITLPFLRPDQVAASTTPLGTAITCTLPLVTLVWLRREPRAMFFALVAFCTWLPTSMVYVSERYVFLPSFALAGLAGIAVARQRWLAPLVAVWCAHQTAWLFYKDMRISQSPHDMIAIEQHVERIAAALPPGKPIYVLNLPSDTFGAQFFAHVVRVVLGDPTRACHLLTIMPEDWSLLQSSSFARVSSHELEVRGVPALMERSRWLFPWHSLATGTRVRRARLGCEVEVTDGTAEQCRTLRFRLPQPLDDCVFLRFTLQSTTAPAARGAVISAGRLDVIKP